MEIGIIGLGKMGMNLGLNIKDHGHIVKGMDISEVALNSAKENGIDTYRSISKLLQSFRGKKIIWLMLPAGELTENVLRELLETLQPGDIVIDGGNANYKDSIRRATTCKENGIGYLDCGTSGGTTGARRNACLMIGGDKEVFSEVEQIFSDIASENGYLYTGVCGSGHFLKMVHNGIEYGMMQAIGEGFQIIEESQFDYDLEKVAKVWNNGSVIRGWLMEIAQNKFLEEPHLENYKGVVATSGEAKWTVETALEMGVAVPTIALSLFMRNLSQEDDSFAAKIVSALRNGFGGHDIVKKEE